MSTGKLAQVLQNSNKRSPGRKFLKRMRRENISGINCLSAFSSVDTDHVYRLVMSSPPHPLMHFG